jgi:hypothetical protein
VVARNPIWPEWWQWELDTSSPHLAKRMHDRNFSETDLRDMLEATVAVTPDHEPGRWLAVAQWNGRWEIVLEPQPRERVVVVVTAYRID